MPSDLIILGRNVGIFGTFNDCVYMASSFLDFKPHDGVALLSGDVEFNFDTGMMTAFDESGEPTFTIDFIPIIAALPKSP